MDRAHLLEDLLDLSEDMLCTIDVGGRLHCLNSAGRRLLGYGRDQVAGMRFERLVHPGDRASVLGEFADISSEPRGFDCRFRRQDGTVFAARCSARLSSGSDSIHLGVQSKGTDRLAAACVPLLTHELGVSLAAIRTYASDAVRRLETDGSASQELVDIATGVKREAEHAHALLGQLGGPSSQSEQEHSEVDLEGVVSDAMAMIERSLNSEQVNPA